jgi:hypothetical protein
MCPATPIGVGGRVVYPVQEGQTVSRISARSEQTQSPFTYTELINHALSEAALAPTVFDALDICGAVMVQLVELCRQAEVRYV